MTSANNLHPVFDKLFGPEAQVSGLRCQAHVARLSGIHRILGTPGYRAAVELVRDELTALGFVEESTASALHDDRDDATLRVETFLMDGSRAYGDWIAPVGWRPRRAELWIEQPERVRLCDFGETPICLHVGSQSTPPQGVRGDLIDIGDGLTPAETGDHDIRGRIVLTSGNVRDIYDEVVRRRGALGILSDNMPWQAPAIGRSSLDLPDLVSFNKLPVRKCEIGSGVFSFGISARQGTHLRELLQRGPVTVRAVVDADAGEGELTALSALIRGSERPDRELLLMAHLCHPQPGANDNATGPALILELARILRAGPPLRHSVRLLFVEEGYGTAAWLLESAAPRGDIRLALNLDMVGGDSAQTRGHLWLDQTPWSRPSYVNDLLAALLAETQRRAPDGWLYGVREHMGGSDHIFFLAPDFTTPAVMLGHEPDLFYHSNFDTVDKTSPREFEKVGQVVLAALRTIDRWTPESVRSVAHLVYTGGIRRIAERTSELLHGETGAGYASALLLLLAKEQAALHSLAAEIDPQTDGALHDETCALCARLADHLAAFCRQQIDVLHATFGPSVARPAHARDGEIVRRTFRGPISSHLMGLSRLYESLDSPNMDGADFYRRRSQEDRTFVRWMFEAANLMDGSRTLGEIHDLLEAELDDAHLDNLHRLVDNLVAAGMAMLE